MPHVAFDPTIVLKPILTARPTPDRGAAPAFESLLDSPPPVDNRPADNKADAARADRDQPAARDNNKINSSDRADSTPVDAKSDIKSKPKSTDTKSDEAPAASGDATKTSATKTAGDEKATGDGKPAGDGKSDTDAKTEGKTSDQIAAEAQLVVGAKPADAAVVAPAAPVPTLTPADAIATAVPAVAEAGAEAAIAAAAGANATIAAPGTEKAGKTAVAGKAGDETKAAKAKTAKGETAKGETETAKADKPTDDKPQAVDAVKTDKADAFARGEAKPAYHAAAVETPGAPAADANLAAPKADAAQVAALTAKTTAPAAPLAATAPAPLASSHAVPLAGVAIEITSKALSSTNHFEIRLDPPELGRIEVRLEVDRDGTITTRMIADRPETLDLLRRDSSGLDRAMQDAGLKTSDNGTQFSLRDQSMNQQQQSGRPSETAQLMVEDEMLSETAARDYGRLAGQRGGVDIRV
ncbi:MAG TPA: flagellar hook-length control protein FliK [Pseudolabrys sp.]|nr:flagellar hook-length control protein FliK [Pseudolabrys sp.]